MSSEIDKYAIINNIMIIIIAKNYKIFSNVSIRCI